MPGMTLYNTQSNPKALTKNLTGGIQIQTINPYEALSDLEGYVIVAYNADYENMNYAAYDGDYYFVTDREKLIGGKLKLYMRMDVLMSFKTGIEKCPMVALRSEMTTKHNAYIQDGLRVTYEDRETVTYKLGNLDGGHPAPFVLVTVG